MKSLVVEDELAPRIVLQRILQVHGLCDAATNAVEALTAVRQAIEQKIPYNLICLDINLREESGINVLKEIRRLEQDSQVPSELATKVLITSAHSEVEQVKAAFHSGCDGFLAKPLDPDRLVKKLKDMGLT